MSKNKKSSFQRPVAHWSTEHRRIKTDEGRTVYLPRHEASGGGIVDFFANIATACLLVFWTTTWGGIFNHVIFGGFLALAIMFQQHTSEFRWPVRFIAWGIFWGMFYYDLHWVPLFRFSPLS